MKKKLIIILSITFTLSSCSTILRGTRQDITIASNPSNAAVIVNGTEQGVTPLKVNLRKGFNKQTIAIEKVGFKRVEIQPQTKFSTVAILSTLGMVGWIVDISTGALREFEKDAYEVDLIKQ
ncbi:PEGA domain-containing protein [Sphingobacterium phlebotomi]|uniref:PEGA domain-containing protein n=1 Tax=Sphingobacterium phlebotomi TaxID=2605433 RepID=A0A5D4HCC8_9SPHI|nr:PEGA domain-containing protein [Sphingobacterium phlebotomi]TYR37469.1 PEGA domain-containing protein [Sphingobacterium phlebotomi]